MYQEHVEVNLPRRRKVECPETLKDLQKYLINNEQENDLKKEANKKLRKKPINPTDQEPLSGTRR